MELAIFIYYKDGKIKALSIEDAKAKSKELIEDGWVHTVTLNPCYWIQYLYNNCDEVDVIAEIKELSLKPNN